MQGDDLIPLRQCLDKRLIQLRDERWSWFQHWRDLSDNILPRRGKFLTTPNQSNRGSTKTTKIIDSTATKASSMLASGMQSGITSPARPWFNLQPNDSDLNDSSPVKIWLDEVHSRMLTVLARSNIYNCLHVGYEEVGVFGTGVVIIDEDINHVTGELGRIVRGTTLTVGEYMLATGKSGEPDTLYREFVMTVAQVVERFGIDNVSPQVKSLHDSDQVDREVTIGAAIEKNDGKYKHPLLRGKPYRSVYWEVGQGQQYVLEIKGFPEKPFMAFRWHTISNEAYGRSPGMDCLGDVKALQKAQLKSAQAIDKMIDPPMVADVAMKNETASLLPGGVTYASGNVGFKPAYEVPPNIQGIELKIKEMQSRINGMFFADLWMMISQLDTVRTATEIQERKQEKMLMLGPVLERLQNELLTPLILRVFNVMLRNDLFPPIPPEMQSGFTPQYVSTLAEAQKSVDTAGIERLFGFVGSIAGAKPEVLDLMNQDEAVEEYADMLGVTPKLLNPPDKVAQIRDARAKAQQQQAAVQNGLAMTQGAQNLSQVDVGGGMNAVQKMIGGPQ